MAAMADSFAAKVAYAASKPPLKPSFFEVPSMRTLSVEAVTPVSLPVRKPPAFCATVRMLSTAL